MGTRGFGHGYIWGAVVWVEVDVGTESEGGAEFAVCRDLHPHSPARGRSSRRRRAGGGALLFLQRRAATPDKERNRSDSPPLAHLVYCIVYFRFYHRSFFFQFFWHAGSGSTRLVVERLDKDLTGVSDGAEKCTFFSTYFFHLFIK